MSGHVLDCCRAHLLRREARTRRGVIGKPRLKQLARTLFAPTELGLPAEDDNEMAPAGAGTAPEARPMEASP